MPTIEPYKIGHCPQCQAQIAVQDANGKWATKKKNWAQMDMTFSDGHRVRTTICKTCLQAPNYETLMGAIFHSDSQACSEKTKEFLKKKTQPVETTNEKTGLKEIIFQKLDRGLPVAHRAKN